MRSRFFWLAILSLSGFVTSFGAHIVATNLPASETVGAGAFMIGLLIAVYDFAELFAKPAAGFVADKRSMKTGAAGWSGGVHRRVVVVPGHQPSAPACCSIRPGPRGGGSLDGLDQSRRALLRTGARSRACGIYNAIKGAGYVVAPTAGGFLAHRFGFAMIFAVSAGIAAAAFALSLFLPGERGGALDDDDDLSFREALGIFTNKELAPMYAVIVINMFLVGILFGFLPVYLHGLGYSTVASGMIVSAATAAYLLIQPVAGWIADRYDTRASVLVGLCLAACSIILLTFVSGVVLIGIVVAAGIGVGTVWTNSDALVGASARANRLGASIGAAQSFKEFGDMVGPLLVGALTQVAGIRTGFVTCGALALLAVFPLARSQAFRSPGVA